MSVTHSSSTDVPRRMCECESVPSHITVVDKSPIRNSELFIIPALSSLQSMVLVPHLIFCCPDLFSFTISLCLLQMVMLFRRFRKICENYN